MSEPFSGPLRGIHCRAMAPGEEDAVLALVMRSFGRFVRPDFSEEGAVEFARAARNFILERPPGHEVFVAEAQGRVAGVLDLREGCHVALFFVEPGLQGRGIGRMLLQHAVLSAGGGSPGGAVTVNSSPGAVAVYERLGFAKTGDERVQAGIRYVPMAREVVP